MRREERENVFAIPLSPYIFVPAALVAFGNEHRGCFCSKVGNLPRLQREVSCHDRADRFRFLS
jgi:hypothetical protein